MNRSLMGYLGLGLIGLLVLMTGIGGLSTLGEAMSKNRREDDLHIHCSTRSS